MHEYEIPEDMVWPVANILVSAEEICAGAMKPLSNKTELIKITLSLCTAASQVSNTFMNQKRAKIM
jgi:hypothetical protein